MTSQFDLTRFQELCNSGISDPFKNTVILDGFKQNGTKHGLMIKTKVALHMLPSYRNQSIDLLCKLID